MFDITAENHFHTPVLIYFFNITMRKETCIVIFIFKIKKMHTLEDKLIYQVHSANSLWVKA